MKPADDLEKLQKQLNIRQTIIKRIDDGNRTNEKWTPEEDKIVQKHIKASNGDVPTKKIIDEIIEDLESKGYRRTKKAVHCRLKKYNFRSNGRTCKKKNGTLKTDTYGLYKGVEALTRPYNQLHVDTAHWLYKRYKERYKKATHVQLICVVAREMNFTEEKMIDILSYPPRKLVD